MGQYIDFTYVKEHANFPAVLEHYEINGQGRGDEVLREFGALLRDCIRDNDLAGRLGGDEFALFIEDITPAIARERGTALVDAAGPLERHSPEGAPKLGLSIGIATYDPSSAEEIEALMARADKAMYIVKRRGKHGCEIAAPADSEDEGPRG